MKKHLKLHPVENSYQCDLCGKSFISWNNIQGHMKSHAGDNQYVCALCGQELISGNYLMRHMKIHTINNSYKCALRGEETPKETHERSCYGKKTIMGIPCYTKLAAHNCLLLVELVLIY